MFFFERIYYFSHGLCTMFFLMASFRLLRRYYSSRLHRVLGFVIAFWALLELKDLLLYLSDVLRGSYWANLLMMIDMTAVPACSYYLLELLSPGWLNAKRILSLGSLFVVLVAGYALTGSDGWLYAMYTYSVLYAITIVAVLVIASHRYNAYLADNYSNTERLNVDWLRWATLLLAVCLTGWLCSCLYSSWISDSLYYLSSLLLWGTIYYYGEEQQVPAAVETSEPEIPNYPPPKNFEQQLHVQLVEKEIFLQPQLTLSDLAAAIGTNRTYLSNYLNSTLQVTFYDYINRFRIERALQMIDDPANRMTMTEIAELCGFNSLSTFRRTFARMKGCSFAEYRSRK